MPCLTVVLYTAAVLTDATPQTVVDRVTWFRRPLLLLLGELGGAQYHLAARNDSLADSRAASYR